MSEGDEGVEEEEEEGECNGCCDEGGCGGWRCGEDVVL